MIKVVTYRYGSAMSANTYQIVNEFLSSAIAEDVGNGVIDADSVSVKSLLSVDHIIYVGYENDRLAVGYQSKDAVEYYCDGILIGDDNIMDVIALSMDDDLIA